MTTPTNQPYPGGPGGEPGYAQPPTGAPHNYAGQQQSYPAPQQGNQPGYPPQGGFPPPQQPGHPGGFPQAGQPPQQARGGRSGIGKILITIGVFVVIGLVVFGARTVGRSDGEKVDIGQCAKLSGTTFKAEFATKECSDPEANYVVAERIDGANKDCATKDYASYYQTGGTEYTLCLRLNVKDGDCIDSNMLGASTKVACTSAADFKIGQVVRGSADKSACGAGATDNDTIVYPKPEPITLCLVSPE